MSHELPPVACTVGGRNVTIESDWSATSDDDGGCRDALVRVPNYSSLPMGSGVRTPLTLWAEKTPFWTGVMLEDPRITRDGSAELAASGNVALLEDRSDTLLFMSYQALIAQDAHEAPYNYSDNNADRFDADALSQLLRFVAEEESFSIGDARRLAAWFGDDVTRFISGLTKPTSAGGVSDISDFEIQIRRATGESGASTPVTAIDLGSGGPASVDTGVIANPEDMLLIGLRCKAPRIPAARRIVRLTNPEFYGIAADDTYQAHQLMQYLADQFSFGKSLIVEDGAGVNEILPVHWRGTSWAELASYAAMFTSRAWGVYPEGLALRDYSDHEWTFDSEHGTEVRQFDDMPFVNRIHVAYPDLAGNDRTYTHPSFSPDPLAEHNVTVPAVFELVDPQPNSSRAATVADNWLPYLQGPAWEAKLLVTRAWKDGVPTCPYHIRPDALGTLRNYGPAKTATDRIADVRYSGSGTEVAFNRSISPLDEPPGHKTRRSPRGGRSARNEKRRRRRQRRPGL